MVSAREIIQRLGLGKDEVAVVEIGQDLEDPSGKSFILDLLFKGRLGIDEKEASAIEEAHPDSLKIDGRE